MFHQPANAVNRVRRSLALDLVEALGERIRSGQLAVGTQLATEAALMAEFDVSRTVVREALSKLQAAGLVQTRHGVGSFVAGRGAARRGFQVQPASLATLRDVVALLELRIGVETEGAALAAQRRRAENITALRAALVAFNDAVASGRDAVAADYRFHLEVARATRNSHFTGLMSTLGERVIPRARLEPAQPINDERRAYLQRVNAEHQNIFEAIQRSDAEGARAAMRTHLANSRERRRLQKK
jgi:GntR family transcriptional regulator, transcriptional repressor for pyruvate dehydrogenase complex